MRSKALLSPAIAFGALLLSAQGFAQFPTIPADTAPDGTWPDASSPAGAGNGGVIVSAWDVVRGVSLVQYVGLKYNDIVPANMEPAAGGTLNFGVLDKWTSTFGASDPANIQYNVTAASVDNGLLSGRQLLVTGLVGGIGSVLNLSVAGAALASFNYVNTSGIAPGCGMVNSCVATASTQPQYAGASYWGSRLAGQLPFVTTASVGVALGFYELVPTSNNPALLANQHQYGNASGFGTWLVGTNGLTTYSIPGPGQVPLPAVVWLLLSGLAGFGAIVAPQARLKRAALSPGRPVASGMS
jgi:hypothetical protein